MENNTNIINEQPRVLVKTRKTDDPNYMKNYYKTHREKILTEMKQLYECPQCGAILWRGHSSRHNKSKKHILSLTQA